MDTCLNQDLNSGLSASTSKCFALQTEHEHYELKQKLTFFPQKEILLILSLLHLRKIQMITCPKIEQIVIS